MNLLLGRARCLCVLPSIVGCLFACTSPSSPERAAAEGPTAPTAAAAGEVGSPGAALQDWRSPTWQHVPEVGEFPARVLGAPGNLVEVSAPSAGRLERLSVAPGDKVEVNAELFRMICPELALAAAAAHAARERTEALATRRAHLQALASEGLVKAAELAQLDLELALARGERARAQAVLAAAGTTPVRADGLVVLRSPIAGVITSAAPALGVYLNPEDGAVVAVSKAEGTRVVATLPAVHLDPSNAVLRLTDGTERALTFLSQSSVDDHGSITSRAWYELADGHALASSHPVKVRLNTGRRARCVPERAVLSRGAQTVVYWRLAQAPAQRAEVRVVSARESEVCFEAELPAEAQIALRPELLGAADAD